MTKKIVGHVEISSQLLEQARKTENAWNELEWVAVNYEKATDEQRARLDRTLAAIDREAA